MLSSTTFQNPQGRSLTLPLWETTSGYTIENIEGLDPVKATIVTSDVATIDGTEYQASSTDQRNIVITIGLSATARQSVKQLRQALYGYFTPKMPITLSFTDDDGSLVSIYGRVESMISPIFAKEPTATISILCFDPYFYNPQQQSLTGAASTSLDEKVLDYVGTAPTGFVFNMQINRSLNSFTIYQTEESGQIRYMEVIHPFVLGDEVTVSTIPGSKFLRLSKAGLWSSILYAQGPGFTWGEFQPGQNKIRVAVEGANIPYTITYTEKFGGL